MRAPLKTAVVSWAPLLNIIIIIIVIMALGRSHCLQYFYALPTKNMKHVPNYCGACGNDKISLYNRVP